jgi:hypothetical protein
MYKSGMVCRSILMYKSGTISHSLFMYKSGTISHSRLFLYKSVVPSSSTNPAQFFFHLFMYKSVTVSCSLLQIWHGLLFPAIFRMLSNIFQNIFLPIHPFPPPVYCAHCLRYMADLIFWFGVIHN